MKRAHKKGVSAVVILSTIIFVAILAIVIFLILNLSSKISEEKFYEGTSFKLEEEKAKVFVYNDEEHTISIDSIHSNSIDLTIQSDPIKINIKIGEEKRVDLTGDGFYNLLIRLEGIEEGVPELYIKRIFEKSDGDLTGPGESEETPSENGGSIGDETEESVECINNEDCTQTCINCDDGTYVCAYSANPLLNQKCVECITDFGCIGGYECTGNVCVVEEQEEPQENQTYPVTNPDTILDCYNEDLSEILCSPEDALGFTTLFGDRLASCEISQGTFALGFEPVFGIFRGYEIQGEQNDNCTVKFWFLENSLVDSSLLNKEMICEYNSSKRTTQDVNDCFEDCCSGELVDAINAI
jgi:hypothetical protein